MLENRITFKKIVISSLAFSPLHNFRSRRCVWIREVPKPAIVDVQMNISYYAKIGIEILKLDLFDFNYVYGSEAINILSYPDSSLPRRGIVIRLISFGLHFRKIMFRKRHVTEAPSDFVLLFTTTQNQLVSLAPLCQQMPNACLVDGGLYDNLDTEFGFPKRWVFFVSLFFIPFVFIRWIVSTAYQRKTFPYFFDQYLLTYGYYIVSERFLRRVKPSAIVASNDHNMPNRVLIAIARKYKIPTFYIQHASVNVKFPPLAFDYALLEGEDALRKYDEIGGSCTKVFLIGSPKTDRFYPFINNKAQIRVVGVCTNTVDPIHRTKELCENLKSSFPFLKVILRPHPMDKRKTEWMNLADEYSFGFSDSRMEISFEFLRRVDTVIAGDSNILLEAAWLNVYPVYFDFLSRKRDWYGFERHGLVERHDSPREIVNTISSILDCKPFVRSKAKYYYATVATSYDGRSGELAVSLIDQLSRQKNLVDSTWQRVLDVNLEAYTKP